MRPRPIIFALIAGEPDRIQRTSRSMMSCGRLNDQYTRVGLTQSKHSTYPFCKGEQNDVGQSRDRFHVPTTRAARAAFACC
jgi:hypothetical protein